MRPPLGARLPVSRRTTPSVPLPDSTQLVLRFCQEADGAKVTECLSRSLQVGSGLRRMGAAEAAPGPQPGPGCFEHVAVGRPSLRDLEKRLRCEIELALRLVEYGSGCRKRKPMTIRECVRQPDETLGRSDVPDAGAETYQIREEMLSIPSADIGRPIHLLDQMGGSVGLPLRECNPSGGDGGGDEDLGITDFPRGFHEVGGGDRRLLEPPAELEDLCRPWLGRDDFVPCPGPR